MPSLCAAQTVPVAGDVPANVAQHLEIVRAAAEQGANVIVFPELSLTGYEIGQANKLRFTLDDERLAPLSDAAKQYGATLIVGAPVKLSSEALFIGALILSPDGERDVYTKHYLGAFPASASVDGVVPPAESTVFATGTRDPELNIDGMRAALSVCADSNRAVHAQGAARRGATAYLASNFVIPSEYAEATGNLQRWAQDYAMTVVFSNYGGESGGLRSAGRSAIYAPGGNVIAEFPGLGLGFVLARTPEQGYCTQMPSPTPAASSPFDGTHVE